MCCLNSRRAATTIVLNHLGTPLHFGAYRNRPKEVFADWRRALRDLARCENVVVKLGGLGMDLDGEIGAHPRNLGSEALAIGWAPYIETAVEAFGPRRCMFESNFPPDRATCSYGALWNAYKRISRQYSQEERASFFAGTAARTYRI